MKRVILTFLLLTISFKISAGDAIEQGVYAFVQGNYTLAIKKLKPYADSGHPVAQYYLGIQYLYGYGVEQSNQEAFDLLYKSAHQKHAEAQYMLGKMYNNGNGVKQSKAQAIKWFAQSAELGYEYAANHLGSIYLNGIGTNIDRSKAIKWFTKAADLGYKNAISRLNSLGVKYRKESERKFSNIEIIQQAREALINNKLDKARQIILPIARNNIPEAQLLLGNIYYQLEDKVLAYDWTLKAAKNGHAQAQNLVGYFNYYSMGIDNKDTDKTQLAKYWYQKSADQNYLDAINNLGHLLYLGKNRKEQIYGYQLLLKATLLEHPKAISTLVTIDDKTYNKLFDKIKANDFIEKSQADKLIDKAILAYKNKQYRMASALWKLLGYAGNTKAQINFALMYLDAQGVNKSLAKALYWLEIAADQQDLEAQLMLAEIYSNNNIGKNSEKQALKWYKKAVKSEDGKAQYLFGMYLFKVNSKSKHAIKWLTRASENNYFQANLVMGYIYENGIGIKPSLEKSILNYKIATENGLFNVNQQETQDANFKADDWKSAREQDIQNIEFKEINPKFSHFENYPLFLQNLKED